ncbi:carboxylating nicotinate-nucleotide diphosphorylase [Thermostilla marina]
MKKEFRQIEWSREVESEADRIIAWAFEEDWGTAGDITSRALLPDDLTGAADLVPRSDGIAAGMPLVSDVLRHGDPELQWTAFVRDGQPVRAGQPIGRIEGNVRALLAVERVLLNLLGRLFGIATTTRRFVDAVAGTRARIYDTRKTTPGWRRLEKYAVRCGGGFNHRLNLEAAVLIKDNHRAAGARLWRLPPSAVPKEAVARTRSYLEKRLSAQELEDLIIEIEVDDLDQLANALQAAPDVVLLDNMSCDALAEAVALRDRTAPHVELEASGGVRLETVREIAQTGVERISVGALTHSATCFDLGLDWA